MSRNKQACSALGNTLVNYTTSTHWAIKMGHDEEPTRAELLADIRSSREALEGKIKSVAIKVNLLHTDLRKVSDKVGLVEGSISELQMEVSVLRKQVAAATSKYGALEARMEDAEGWSHRNNV
ncbi:hypothetical protein NDU88_004836 [Pleurodeles waltl]|uniref:Uncharacterized protein n=1 Tax=Pleurodeles waltl TaxID=8319 RepID=A0AAV7VHD7_PLEWA|nr:hypothetical protein NDU88_004836 [Pleurodeles waltl]